MIDIWQSYKYAPPWVFFTFFKLRKWNQIVQSITYSGHREASEPFNVQCSDLRETSQLICSKNYVTGFFMMRTRSVKMLVTQNMEKINFKTEAATQRFSVKKLFLKTFQNSPVCHFQSFKSPVEMDGLLSKLSESPGCYISWLNAMPDDLQRGLYVKSYCFFETIA